MFCAHVVHINSLYGSHSDMCSKGKWPGMVFPRWTTSVHHTASTPLRAAGSSLSALCTVHLLWSALLCLYLTIWKTSLSCREPGILQPSRLHRVPAHSRHPDTRGVFHPWTTTSAPLSVRAGQLVLYFYTVTSEWEDSPLNVACGRRGMDQELLCPYSLMVELSGWREHGPRALLHKLALHTDSGASVM